MDRWGRSLSVSVRAVEVLVSGQKALVPTSHTEGNKKNKQQQ